MIDGCPPKLPITRDEIQKGEMNFDSFSPLIILVDCAKAKSLRRILPLHFVVRFGSS